MSLARRTSTFTSAQAIRMVLEEEGSDSEDTESSDTEFLPSREQPSESEADDHLSEEVEERSSSSEAEETPQVRYACYKIT